MIIVTEATGVRFVLSTTLTTIVTLTSITGTTTTVTSVTESDAVVRSETETETESVPVMAAETVIVPETVPGTDLTTRIDLTVRPRHVETRIAIGTVREAPKAL